MRIEGTGMTLSNITRSGVQYRFPTDDEIIQWKISILQNLRWGNKITSDQYKSLKGQVKHHDRSVEIFLNNAMENYPDSLYKYSTKVIPYCTFEATYKSIEPCMVCNIGVICNNEEK